MKNVIVNASNWVMIPTYNESENIKQLLDTILDLGIGINIVVVDDRSPDGTGAIVKVYEKQYKNIHLIERSEERGRGLAGKAGYQYCMQHGAKHIIEMDADFSHDPKYIPKLLAAMKDSDLCLGSRFAVDQDEIGKQVGRSNIRRIITWGANWYIRATLGIHVADCNSGFRCFKRAVLEGIDVDSIQSKGPAIVQEVLFRASQKGFKITEIPITFVDRQRGESKLGIIQLLQGYTMILKLKLMQIMGRI